LYAKSSGVFTMRRKRWSPARDMSIADHSALKLAGVGTTVVRFVARSTRTSRAPASR
jgi:hypothetical protein